jgi:hypothetical protein
VTLAAPFEGFEVRFVPGARALKEYVCPECTGTIPERTGHVVAWPVDDNEARRHWHSHCWRLAVRRGRVDGI